ncbi:MAG: DNA translocase FtsK [Clostridiales bacterium]|nr:DNA translocase FtsK [Clostridiales bacterium]
MGLKTYTNFLAQAYRMGEGGGLIGSFLGYPLTRLITKWGTLVALLALSVFMLQKSGALSVGDVAAKALNQGKKAAEGVSNVARKTVNGINERRRRKQEEELFNEQIYDGQDVPPLDTRGLSGKKRVRSRVTPIKGVGDEYTVPSVTNKKPKRSAGTGMIDDGIEDVFSRIERDKPAVKPAPPARKVKPETSTAKAPEPAYAARHVPSKEEPKPEQKPASAQTPRQPQQPKPSWFDGVSGKKEEGKTVVQNTEQGKPSETTYVKPPQAVKAEAPETKPQPKPETSRKEPKTKPIQPRLYVYPSMSLMETGGTKKAGGLSNEDMDRKTAEVLIKTLQSFSVPVKLTGISHGPSVTRFEILPAPGIKVSKVASYADDIAMALEAVSVRIEAPIPGKNAVGVEVPNTSKEVVHLRDVLESPEARKNTKRLMFGLGKDNSGKYIVADLAGMPHVLIAGQTGSGKSVCINSIIISILYRAKPDEVKMILIDPKMVELNVYNTIPHLLVPVVTDPKKAAGALEWAVGEMTRRYKVFAEKGAKNIESYNQRLAPNEEKMPQIVIIIDELADLMMTSPRDVEDAINRLAQLARAAGMHLVIATQRPSVDVITGLIKANIPTRIAFTVASGVDSRTILDVVGAEKLLGKGDMLYLPPDRNKPMRLQGAWVSEEEVQHVVDFVSSPEGNVYDEDMLIQMENATLSDAEKKDKKEEEASSSTDELFEEALRACVEAGQASISMLQRRLRIGYARAGRLIDEMALRGYVSQSEGSKSREVLITRAQLDEIFNGEN